MCPAAPARIALCCYRLPDLVSCLHHNCSHSVFQLSPGPRVLLLPPTLQEVHRVSWYWFPGTLVSFPSCVQFWCTWHGSVLELEEEKEPRGQVWHCVFSKGEPGGRCGTLDIDPNLCAGGGAAGRTRKQASSSSAQPCHHQALPQQPWGSRHKEGMLFTKGAPCGAAESAVSTKEQLPRNPWIPARAEALNQAKVKVAENAKLSSALPAEPRALPAPCRGRCW